MSEELPIKLKIEPLIDAVFEVRFSGGFPTANILPGLLYGALDGQKSIESLPVSQLPKHIRDSDPNLKFSPVSRLSWDQFYINIGDQSLSISIKLPYPGWDKFQSAIVKVMRILKDSNTIGAIDRYALKYIDLIPSTNLQEQVSFIKADITLAGHKLEKEAFQLRIEMSNGGFVNVVNLISSAKAILQNGEQLEGLVIDIDTISNERIPTIAELLLNFESKLSAIRKINKETFFGCLTEDTIKSLGPIYEHNKL